MRYLEYLPTANFIPGDLNSVFSFFVLFIKYKSRINSGTANQSGRNPRSFLILTLPYFTLYLRVAGEVRSLVEEPDLACNLPRVGSCSLVLVPLSLSELRAVVFGLNGSPSCGDDGISIRMFRLSFDAVGMVLLHLVNSSITQSDVPASWKHSLSIRYSSPVNQLTHPITVLYPLYPS